MHANSESLRHIMLVLLRSAVAISWWGGGGLEAQ